MHGPLKDDRALLVCALAPALPSCSALNTLPPCDLPLPLPSAACRQYVALHPANVRVASALYFVIQQVASLLCLGCRVPLEAVAQDACPCAKCIAVVWSLEVRFWAILCCTMTGGMRCLAVVSKSKLGSDPMALSTIPHPWRWAASRNQLAPTCPPKQVSLGLVWPMLMVWRSQLSAAKEWAIAAADREAAQAAQQLLQQAAQQGQQQVQEQQQDGRPVLPRSPVEQQAAATAAQLPAAVAEYRGSLYARLCAPVLSVASACPGGWGMVVSLAALYPYLATVLTEPQCIK